MKTIEYFKLQAKNLHKDFKTQKPYFDPSLGDNLYGYEPKFFDVDALVTDFDIDEDDFTLMNAQHYIVYSGETDHPIPWQTDHLKGWRTVVSNAIEL